MPSGTETGIVCGEGEVAVGANAFWVAPPSILYRTPPIVSPAGAISLTWMIPEVEQVGIVALASPSNS